MRQTSLILIILFLAFVGACGGSNTGVEGAVPGEKVLHYGSGSDPKTIDPNKQSLVLEGYIMYSLFEGLVTYDRAGSIIPGQAESWEISEDGLTYIFKLKEGLIWSDGQPVTAEDFAFSMRRLLNPMTAAELAFSLYAIKNAEAIIGGKLQPEELGVTVADARTLVIELDKPQPALLASLASVQGLPVPKHVVEQYGSAWIKAEHIVSNGAYLFRNWQVGNRLEIERNPLFRDTASVAIDRVFFYPTADDEAALRRIRAGELHIQRSFPMAKATWLRENMPEYLHTAPWVGSYFYILNVQRPPLDDVRVRRALNMLIDRDSIVRLILQDLGWEAAYSMVPSTLRGWEIPAAPEWASWSREQRVEAAKALIAEAGFGPENPIELNLSYNTDESHKRIAIAISKMWEAVGIVTTLENFEFRVHTDNVNQGNFDVARRGWIGIDGMPEFFLGMFETQNLSLNSGRWSSAAFDAALSDALNLSDPEARNAQFLKAEKILQDELPLLPIYFYISRNLVSPRVTGWIDNPMDAHRIRWLDLMDE